jgi:hypothetical protein
MKIRFAGIQLTDWADFPAQQVSVNGQTVFEAVDIVRAAARRFFSRLNDSNVLQFAVSREFATHREAQVFLLTHFSLLPKFGLCEVVCGVTGETPQSVFMSNAILSASPAGTFGGVEATVAYTIQFGIATTDIPPNFLIGGEEMILRGKENIPSDVDSIAVLFDPAFPPGTDVIVTPAVAKPSGSSSNLFATVRDDLVDVNGFTAELSADTTDALHKLNWIAIGT